MTKEEREASIARGVAFLLSHCRRYIPDVCWREFQNALYDMFEKTGVELVSSEQMKVYRELERLILEQRSFDTKAPEIKKNEVNN